MRRSAIVFGGLVFLSALVYAAAAPDPRILIKQTADTLVGVIKEGKTYFPKDPDRFYAEVQKVLDPTIDFDTFSRGVMAVYYKRATPAQREKFEASFKAGLIRDGAEPGDSAAGRALDDR